MSTCCRNGRRASSALFSVFKGAAVDKRTSSELHIQVPLITKFLGQPSQLMGSSSTKMSVSSVALGMPIEEDATEPPIT